LLGAGADPRIEEGSRLPRWVREVCILSGVGNWVNINEGNTGVRLAVLLLAAGADPRIDEGCKLPQWVKEVCAVSFLGEAWKGRNEVVRWEGGSAAGCGSGPDIGGGEGAPAMGERGASRFLSIIPIS
jgi:hypothetical protein